MATERPAIHGNRLVLTGSVMYLLEWAAIIPAGNSGPSEPGLSASKVLPLYTSHPTAVVFLASWVSVVLLGRVLLVLGIRDALRSISRDTTLVTFAAASMALSVAVEVASEAAVGAGVVVASHAGSADVVRALDTLAGFTWNMIFAPLGLAVALSAWAMLRSRAFPTWIPVVGLIGGIGMLVGGVAGGPGYLHEGVARGLMNAGRAAVPLFWIWMLATGIFLIRRSTSRAAAVA